MCPSLGNPAGLRTIKERRAMNLAIAPGAAAFGRGRGAEFGLFRTVQWLAHDCGVESGLDLGHVVRR